MSAAYKVGKSGRDPRARTEVPGPSLGGTVSLNLEEIDPVFEAVLRGERDQLPHDAGCRFDAFMGTWDAVSTCGERHDIDPDAPGQPRP